MAGRRRILGAIGAALLLASCGGITRGEMDEEIQSRGGGLGSALPLEALVAVEEEVGDEVVLRSMSVNLGSVTIDVLVPGTNDELDSYTYGTSGLYGGGGLSDPRPVTGVGRARDLRRQLFRPERVAFDDLDAMVDQAIAEADLPEGYAQNISINRTGRRVTISINVTNPRDTVRVDFNADGTPAGGPS